MLQPLEDILNDEVSTSLLTMNCVRSFYFHRTKRNRAIFDELRKISHISKNLYNQMLFYCQQYYEVYEKMPSYFDLNGKGMLNQPSHQITPLKWISLSNDEVRYGLSKHLKNWYNELGNSHIADITLKMFYGNIQSFFALRKSFFKDKKKFSGMPMFPHFLKKDQFYYHFAKRRVKFDGQYLYLKIHPEKLAVPIPFSQIPSELIHSKEIKQVRFYLRTPKLIKIEVVFERPLIEVPKECHNILGLDRGVNNLLAGITNIPSLPPFLLCGKLVKSINREYNRLKGYYQHKLAKTSPDKTHVKSHSIKIEQLGLWRKKKLMNIFHVYTTYIIQYCQKYEITEIVLGKNKGWKQNISLSKRTNQKFVSIPYTSLESQLNYKCQLAGIRYTESEESYTSKIDHLAFEPMPSFSKKLAKIKIKYLGKRIKRGLFQSSTHKLLNADINAAIGIIRKIRGDEIIDIIKSNKFLCNPTRFTFQSLVKRVP
jgi:putative transposase